MTIKVEKEENHVSPKMEDIDERVEPTSELEEDQRQQQLKKGIDATFTLRVSIFRIELVIVRWYFFDCFVEFARWITMKEV